MLGWSFLTPLTPSILDIVTGLVVYVLNPLSPVNHTTRVRTEPYQPLGTYEIVEDI